MKHRCFCLTCMIMGMLLFSSCGIHSEQAEVLEPAISSGYLQDGHLVIPEADLPAEPSSCTSFADMDWGSSYTELFESGLENYAVRYGACYAGYTGSACYFYDEGTLRHGELQFYSTDEISDADLYINVRSYLVSLYGEPDTVLSEDISLEDIIYSDQGLWGEMWTGIASGDGGKVQISIIFDPEMTQTIFGKTSVRFSYISSALQ